MRIGGFLLGCLLPAGLVSAQVPVVATGGVLNAASLVKGQPVALGSFVAIFGSGFGSGGLAGSVPWPTSLGGTTVLMNGIPAPLYAVTDGQINAQVPFEALPAGQTSGSVIIIVQHNSQNSAVQSFQVTAYAPGIFSISGSGLGVANAINPDGTLCAPSSSVPGFASHPTGPGQTVIVLATGFGATDSSIQTGYSSSDKLRYTATIPTVLVGGIPAHVAFSGLSPQFPAVNQLNIVLPVGVPSGSAVPIQVSLGGITTTAQLNIAINPSATTVTLGAPLTTLLTPASQPKSLATYGNYAYLCGTAYVAVLDITNPANPQLKSTFGGNLFNNVSNLQCYVETGTLVAFADTGSTLVSGGPSVTFFDLSDPSKPKFLQQSALGKQYVGGVAHRGSTAFATYNVINFAASSFLNQGGDLASIDLSNPASPRYLSALSGNTGSGLGVNSFFDVVAVNDTIAYATSSTSTGSNTTTGSGVLLVVDTSNPSSLTVLKQIPIPNSRQALSVRFQGTLAVVLSDVDGWRNPIDFSQGAIVGPTNVSIFDIANPSSPALLTTITTSMRPDLTGGGGAPVGTGQFVFAGQRTGGQSGILLVDARNQQSPLTTAINTPDILLNAFVVAPNFLYALVNNTGVLVYQVPE
jgi:uncharacterized protein (TIGR03437 family)